MENVQQLTMLKSEDGKQNLSKEERIKLAKSFRRVLNSVWQSNLLNLINEGKDNLVNFTKFLNFERSVIELANTYEIIINIDSMKASIPQRYEAHLKEEFLNKPITLNSRYISTIVENHNKFGLKEFLYFMRTPKYMEKRFVSFFSNELKQTCTGIIEGYYFGNKEQNYPLRFKVYNIKTQKSTFINEDKIKF